MSVSIQQDDASVHLNAADAVRQRLLEGTTPVPTFAQAVKRTTRTVSTWINDGLPCIYVGNTPHVLVEQARAWLLGRRQKRREPRKQGRPRKGDALRKD